VTGIDQVLGLVWKQLHQTTGTTGREEGAFQELFHRLCMVIRPRVFLEVGAYDARVSARVARTLPNTTVCAFEANPHVWGLFRGDVPSAVRYLNCAITSRDGQETFYIPRSMPRRGGPRMLDEHNSTGSLKKRDQVGVAYDEVRVPSTTLDHAMRDVPDEGPVVMWVDVEGAVGDVLRGAPTVLAGELAMMYVELDERRLWAGQWLDEDVHEYMRARGYLPLARDCEKPAHYNQIFMSPRHCNRKVRRVLADYVADLVGSAAG
jgi:FkbM family methyltransferase